MSVSALWQRLSMSSMGIVRWRSEIDSRRGAASPAARASSSAAFAAASSRSSARSRLLADEVQDPLGVGLQHDQIGSCSGFEGVEHRVGASGLQGVYRPTMVTLCAARRFSRRLQSSRSVLGGGRNEGERQTPRLA